MTIKCLSTPSPLFSFACALACFYTSVVGADEQPDSLDELRAARREAAHKSYRVIFNNDGNETVSKVSEVGKDAFLRPRSYGLEDSDVGAIFYCTAHGAGLFVHTTEIGSLFDTKLTGSNNMTAEYIEAGYDPLGMIIEFAHDNGMDAFWSYRMNDTHDAGRDYVLQDNAIKMEHPELMIGRKNETSLLRGTWSGLNFALPEVRALTLSFFEEVLDNYDVDGIELDFWRHTNFFRTTAEGRPATPEEVFMMTELMQDVRILTEEKGLERGRPILVSVRVPDSLEYAMALGLDVREWLEQDLFDIMVVSGYTRFNPWSESVELAKNYNKTIYAGLSDTRVKSDDNARKLRRSMESYRARVTNALYAGVDGVYFFNLFDPHHPIFQEAGSLEELVGKDKRFFVSFRSVGRSYGLSYNPYRNIPVLSPDAPMKFNPGVSESIPLFVGEDIATAVEAGNTPQLTLHVVFDENVGADGADIEFNGRKLDTIGSSAGVLAYPLNPGNLIQGKNEIKVTNLKDRHLVIKDVYLDVIYNKAGAPKTTSLSE